MLCRWEQSFWVLFPAEETSIHINFFFNVLYHEYKNSFFQGNPGTYFIESAILMYTGCSVSASAILLFIFCCEEKKKPLYNYDDNETDSCLMMSLCSFLVCQYLAQSSQSYFVAGCCMLTTKMMISHLVKLYNRWFCLLFFFLFVISTKR